jgi:hypothetical protein
VVAITNRIGNLPGEDGIADQMFGPFMPEVVFIRP